MENCEVLFLYDESAEVSGWLGLGFVLLDKLVLNVVRGQIILSARTRPLSSARTTCSHVSHSLLPHLLETYLVPSKSPSMRLPIGSV